MNKELQNYLEDYNLYQLKTIYIGGGNPSISPDSLEKIDKYLSFVNYNCIKEYTVECNPVNINLKLLNTLKKIGCTRISFGIQSFDKEVLEYCNRLNQDNKIIYNALTLIDNDFNISIDLINGLPLQNPEFEIEQLEKFLNNFKSINHISFYDLSIEEKCKFFKNKNLILPDYKILKNYEFNFKKLLKKYNFKRYEISNYCKNNNYSKHNLNYWKYKNYLGLGPASHSTIGDMRIENVPDFDLYCKNNNYKKLYILNLKEQLEEYILMGLRLLKGINFYDFKKRFNLDFIKIFENVIKKYKKLFIIKKNYIQLTNKGLDILNKILVAFFLELDKKSF